MPWAGLISSSALGIDEPFSALDKIVTLSELPQHCKAALQLIPKLKAKNETHEGGDFLAEAIGKSISAANLLNHRLAALAELANTIFESTEFGFLFDRDRQLLSIGYRLVDGSLDPNFYDLLASEARPYQLHRNC
jgi:cyclic beta-1,2-glucan synthetase